MFTSLSMWSRGPQTHHSGPHRWSPAGTAVIHTCAFYAHSAASPPPASSSPPLAVCCCCCCCWDETTLNKNCQDFFFHRTKWGMYRCRLVTWLTFLFSFFHGCKGERVLVFKHSYNVTLACCLNLPQAVVLHWHLPRADPVCDHGWVWDQCSTWLGTLGCIFLQCTGWHLYKYNKIILENIRPWKDVLTLWCTFDTVL